MKNLYLKVTLVLFSLLFIIAGCNKFEFDKIAKGAWNPNLAVPLAHANFGVYDILSLQDSNSLITPQNGGILTLVYSSDIFSLNGSTLLTIQDINESINLDLNDLGAVPVPTFPGTITTNSNEVITLDASGSEIHQAKFKSGILTFNVSSDLKHDLTCKVTFPEILINGAPVSTTVSLIYTGTVPHSATSTVDLTDALADFTLGNTDFNKFNAAIETTITGTGQPIDGNESVAINLNFNGLSFKNASGYFGQFDLGSSSDTTSFELFKNTSNGYLQLTNPKIKFIAENTFGLPIQLDFLDMKIIDTATGNQLPLAGYPTSHLLQSAGTTGQPTYTEIELNTNNTSNLSSLISSVPKLFVFSASAVTNPNGNVPPLNFISDQSTLNIKTSIELPLEGFVYGFEMKDTIDFSFNEDVSLLESVMFRLNIDNGFPMELKTQIVFLDQNHNPVFTVFNTPESVIESALVDNNGKVNQRSKKITDIDLNHLQIAQLPNVKYLLFNTYSQTLDGPNGKVVKFYDDYTIDLKLGLQVQGKVQL